MLSVLYFYKNNNITSECFELIVQALHGRPLEGRRRPLELFINDCNITNISALDTYTPSNLRSLGLGGTNIGRQGCITLANILQKEDSNLIYLAIDKSGIGDEEVDLLVTSLENNTKLKEVYLPGNDITERGVRALLKLLIDASSIKNTYNSNHTLEILQIYSFGPSESEYNAGMRWEHVQLVLEVNKLYQSSHAAGRAKVIKYQLNSQNRRSYAVYKVLNIQLVVSSQTSILLLFCRVSLH